MGSIELIIWYAVHVLVSIMLMRFLHRALHSILNRIFGEYEFLDDISLSVTYLAISLWFLFAILFIEERHLYNWYPALQEEFYKRNGIVHNISSIYFLFGLLGLVMSFVSVHKRKKEEKINLQQRKIDEDQKIENDRISNEKKQKEEAEQAEWQKQLDREIERERRLAEVRHESTLMAMQAQIKLYGEYKEKGLDIEKQIFDMRKNLIELEGQENKAMLDEVRQALDDLDN
jgi:hypothetical protein